MKEDTGMGTDQARWQSAGCLRALIQNTLDVITVLAADGTVHYKSPSVERELGYTAAELIGTSAFALIHPDDLPAAQRLFTDLLAQADGSAMAELRCRHKDGSWRWLELIGTNAAADPCIEGIVVTSRDITKRHAAEAALRENELRRLALLAATERQAQELALLDRVRTALARELDLPDLIRTVVEGVATTFGYPLVSLYLREGDVLFLQYQVGYERVIDRVPIDTGVAGRVVRSGQPELVAFGPADPDFLAAIDGLVSEICVPLHDKDQVAGVLILESKDGIALGEDDLRLMLALGEHVDVAIGRARLYDQVRQSEARFRALVQHASDLVTVVDAGRIRRYVSPAYESVLGYPLANLVGQPIDAICHPDDASVARRFFSRLARRPGAVDRVEVRVRHRDGSLRWLETIATNRLDDPDVRGFVVNSRDITERKAFEARLAHLAFHDPLTDLPNRVLFLEQVAAALAVAEGERDALIAILLLDLDGFKLVNDSRGHGAGDELLMAVGKRLRDALPPGVTLARLGGDEFAVLLTGVADRAEPERLGTRLIEALRCPFAVDRRDVFVTASAGVVVHSRRRSTPGELLRKADTALYQAKSRGPGTCVVFAPRMQQEVLTRMNWETALHGAAARGELRLHYQPTVELTSGRVVGIEALLRWQHPTAGLLEPHAFVRLAEETGVIVDLGRWVLGQACRRAREWPGLVGDRPPIVSVNLSGRELREEDLVVAVSQSLAAAGLAPDRLELEITETALMPESPEILGMLCALRDQGVRLALDDFGTGFSSLGRLGRLPVNTLKIDRVFIAALGREASTLAIVRAITTLAHDLGLTVTAEGVETAEQATILRALQVDHGQGYYFAPSLPGEAITAFLDHHAWQLTGPATAAIPIPAS